MLSQEPALPSSCRCLRVCYRLPMPRLARCWSTAALVKLPRRMRACTPATRPMLTRFFSAPLSDGSAKIVTELFPSDFPLIILDWSRSFQRCPMSSITMYRVAILPRNCCSSSEGATSPSSWGLGRSQPTKEEILLLLDDCRRDGYRQAFTEHQIQVPQKVSVIVYDDSTLAQDPSLPLSIRIQKGWGSRLLQC